MLEDDYPAVVNVLFRLATLSSRNMHEEELHPVCRFYVEGFVNAVECVREDGGETVVDASTSPIYGNRTEPSPKSMDAEVHTAYEVESRSLSTWPNGPGTPTTQAPGRF